MIELAWFVAGFLTCAVLAGLLFRLRRKYEEAAIESIHALQQQREQAFVQALDQLKTSFAALSREALSGNADDFLKLAKTRLDQQTTQGEQALDAKKKLIDARLTELDAKLVQLNAMLQGMEKQRAESYGSLKSLIERATQTTSQLQLTTSKLHEALSHPKRRGQWGERMAEDILRLAGFVEGVNYVKQQREGGGSYPDFTFPLPGGNRVNMDVKFPLANYLNMLDAKEESERAAYADRFIRDVRSRIKEVTTREYVDVASGTVDYVLVFIPNEQIHGFIHEMDPTLLDEALNMRVVLCSPLTLYAVLALIRQAAEQFRLERSSDEILKLLGAFRKQWGRYVESMAKLGRKLEEALKEYQDLLGTRTRQLDRQLDRVEQLQAARGFLESSPEDLDVD